MNEYKRNQIIAKHEDDALNRYLNDRDRDIDTAGMCQLCQCVEVDDINEYCAECQQAEAEMRED